eukprot:614701_1
MAAALVRCLLNIRFFHIFSLSFLLRLIPAFTQPRLCVSLLILLIRRNMLNFLNLVQQADGLLPEPHHELAKARMLLQNVLGFIALPSPPISLPAALPRIYVTNVDAAVTKAIQIATAAESNVDPTSIDRGFIAGRARALIYLALAGVPNCARTVAVVAMRIIDEIKVELDADALQGLNLFELGPAQISLLELSGHVTDAVLAFQRTMNTAIVEIMSKINAMSDDQWRNRLEMSVEEFAVAAVAEIDLTVIQREFAPWIQVYHTVQRQNAPPHRPIHQQQQPPVHQQQPPPQQPPVHPQRQPIHPIQQIVPNPNQQNGVTLPVIPHPNQQMVPNPIQVQNQPNLPLTMASYSQGPYRYSTAFKDRIANAALTTEVGTRFISAALGRHSKQIDHILAQYSDDQINATVIMNKIKTREALRLCELQASGIGQFSQNQLALSSQSFYDIIIFGHGLPNALCIYLVSKDLCRWHSIADEAHQAPGILYKKKANIQILWGDLNLAVIGVAMEIITTSNEEEMVIQAKIVLERTREINTFMQREIIPMINDVTIDPQDMWRAVILAFDVNRSRIAKKKAVLAWDTQDFYFAYSTNVKDPSRAIPSLSSAATARIKLDAAKDGTVPSLPLKTKTTGWTAKKGKEPPVCWHCGRTGHRRNRCLAYKRLRKEQRERGRVRNVRDMVYDHGSHGRNAYGHPQPMVMPNLIQNTSHGGNALLYGMQQGVFRGGAQQRAASNGGNHQGFGGMGTQQGLGGLNPPKAVYGGRHNNVPRKGKLCRYFTAGKPCPYGDRCRFAHA